MAAHLEGFDGISQRVHVLTLVRGNEDGVVRRPVRSASLARDGVAGVEVQSGRAVRRPPMQVIEPPQRRSEGTAGLGCAPIEKAVGLGKPEGEAAFAYR